MTFAERAQRRFGFLVERHGFTVRCEQDWWVVYETAVCRVDVVLDRIDVTVEFSSREREVIRRKKVTAFAVARACNAALVMTPPPPEVDLGDPAASQEWQLERWAQVVRECCGDLLRGDFSSSTRPVDGKPASKHRR